MTDGSKYLEDDSFWEDLSPHAQIVFTKLYEHAIKRQEFITHPKTKPMSTGQWKTIVHNMALIAAWCVDGEPPNMTLDIIETNPSDN